MILMLRRKFLLIATVCMMAGVCVGVGVKYFPDRSAFGGGDGRLRIIVDAGHGAYGEYFKLKNQGVTVFVKKNKHVNIIQIIIISSIII